MEKVYTVKEVREQVKAWRREGLTVGLVPTMGRTCKLNQKSSRAE